MQEHITHHFVYLLILMMPREPFTAGFSISSAQAPFYQILNAASVDIVASYTGLVAFHSPLLFLYRVNMRDIDMRVSECATPR